MISFTIFLGYGTMTVSAQQLGSDQPCSASYPCHKICGNHVCAPGEIPGASQSSNNTMTQKTPTSTPLTPQKTNQTMTQNATTIPTLMQPLKFSTKGQISNSSGIAPGTVVWTILNGNNATFIFHGVNGLEVIRLATTPDPICGNAQSQICLDTTVTQARDPDHLVPVLGKAKINIHPIQNQETVAFLTGAFQNIIIQIDLTKIWTYSSGASINAGTMIPNPASTYCINHGGTLQIKTGPAGQYGNCTFPNGSQCEEWQYYRGECSPTQTTNATSTNSTFTNSTAMQSTLINPNSMNSTSANSTAVHVTNSTSK